MSIRIANSLRIRVRTGRHVTVLAGLLGCIVVLFALACDRGQPQADQPPPTDSPTARENPGAQPAEAPQPVQSSVSDIQPSAAPASALTTLMSWVDPEAQAVFIRRRPLELDPDALSTIFAWTPRMLAMWRDLEDASAGLESLVKPPAADSAESAGSLGTLIDASAPALVFTPAVATGNYMVARHLAGDSAGTRLIAAGFRPSGDAAPGQPQVFNPTRSFRWRVIVLDDRHLAFVPVREIGSGLGPLTAGRDLPNSEMKAALLTTLGSDSEIELFGLSAGPMLHFDLDAQVLQLEFVVRRWQGGLDYQGRMIVSDDPGPAVAALRARSLDGENHQMRSIAGRVAFDTEQGTIGVRLQLTRDDLRHLKVR